MAARRLTSHLFLISMPFGFEVGRKQESQTMFLEIYCLCSRQDGGVLD